MKGKNMSKQGIQKIAKVFSIMQETRQELMREATLRDKTDLQDIRLAQLLEDGNNAMKDGFCSITLEKQK
jgi:hypothetical protein